MEDLGTLINAIWRRGGVREKRSSTVTDRNGKELKPGDKVMIVCEIKRIDDWPAGQWHPMSKGHSAVYLVANSNDGEPSHLYLHTPEMELVETPQGESKCQET